jgi:hypothetical protein
MRSQYRLRGAARGEPVRGAQLPRVGQGSVDNHQCQGLARSSTQANPTIVRGATLATTADVIQGSTIVVKGARAGGGGIAASERSRTARQQQFEVPPPPLRGRMAELPSFSLSKSICVC